VFARRVKDENLVNSMTRRANAQVDELANLKKGSLYWKAFAMWMYGWLLIQRGAREVRAEPSGQGVVGIARPVGASQACTRQPGSGSVTAVRHPSAVTARNEEVFYGGPSGSATRCNVQCERDGAVGSAGGNRGSDCALGSATQGVGATLASLLAALTAPNKPVRMAVDG